MSPYLETQYSQSPYFHNVIFRMKLEHDTLNIILNILQDRNHVYPYSVCLCFTLPPVCLLCQNHEVVVQPWTGTDPYLGSVSTFTTSNLVLMPHLFPSFFWVFLVLFSILTYSHHQPFIIVSLSCVALSTHLLSLSEVRPTLTFPAVATCQLPLPISVPCATFLRLMKFFVTVSPPPLSHLACF